MRRLVTIALITLPILAGAQEAIGKWRDCLDYSAVYHVATADDHVFAAGKGAVFAYYPASDSTVILSKATGMNDVGVATIAYDASTSSLVVAYTNSNIDIVKDGYVHNLSDIKRNEAAGNKSINQIRFHDGAAYLATGFGVVVIDLGRHEIRETYYLGSGGGRIVIHDLAFTADSIFAATAEGLKSLPLSERHPSISERWHTDTRLDGLTITTLDTLGGSLLLATYSFDPEFITLYHSSSGGYSQWASGDIKSMHAGGGQVLLSTLDGAVRYNSTLQPIDTIDSYTWGPIRPLDAVSDDNGILWIGHEWGGLIGLAPDKDYGTLPQGPFSADNAYRLIPAHNRMLLCPGGRTTTYTNAWITPNLLTATRNGWHGLNLSNGALDGRHDVVDAAVNPLDTSETIAVLWGNGVASIRDNEVVTFYDNVTTNGVLQPYVMSDGNSTMLTGAAVFDRTGNLWVLNSHSRYALAVRRTDGSWEHLSTSAFSSMLQVDKLIADSVNNWLWFAGRDNAIYVHDGVNRLAKINPNHGSKLQTEDVNAIVQDRIGNIWIGTNKGIKVIYDSYNTFQYGGIGEESPVTCNNITITNGSFFEYLMAYENITTIAVDGANRKWVGTAGGGIYLLSANGLEQLLHFTADDSPLFSNKVICIGIQPTSGEVYIGTDQGLQVYRGTATYAESIPDEHIYAFPNPVRPGYDGPVAIKGFTRDALVHITDAAGHVVYSTNAHGGQAVWNTRTANGERVASGVYYVFASDAMGKNRSVAKILIVR